VHRLAPAVILFAIVTACGALRSSDEGFTILHVDDLASRLNATPPTVTVLDANRPDFREREGVIPGAVLLSSYRGYDVAKELPAKKDAPLVFYCADTH
jgi:hypothetical protein